MEKTYYSINEELARRAHEMYSFSEYKMGSKTENYQASVDEAWDLVEEIRKARPKEAERAERIADSYAKKLAENMNKASRIGTMCPSVMISGAGNFPVAKHRKQMDAMDRNYKAFGEISKAIEKLEAILRGKDVIKSDDADAVDRLREKIASLEDLQERMKRINAFWRKNGTLDGCQDLSEEMKAQLIAEMNSSWRVDKKPFPSYTLTNNSQNIRTCKKRLEVLEKERAANTTETENEICKVMENVEAMRIQLLFDGKPDEGIRNILKHYGFRWSPKAGAWQRQLNANGRYAAQMALQKIREL